LESLARRPISALQKRQGLEVIVRLITNILDNPDEPKYRSVNTTNKIIAERLLLNGSPEGTVFENILLACGFERDGTQYSFVGLESDGDLQGVRDLFRGIIMSLNLNENPFDDSSATELRSEASSSVSRSNYYTKRQPRSANNAADEIAALRKEQATRYKSRSSEATPDIRDDRSTSTADSSSTASRIWAFFGGTATTEPSTSSTQPRRRFQMKTMKDLRPPPRQG